MPGILKIVVAAIVATVFMIAGAQITAQEIDDVSAVEAEQDSAYYSPPTYQPNPRAIVHAKAQAHASQRQARLASMSWYGMSNSRPMASCTPFTSRYSPVWEMPGGRPYSWYPSYRWPAYAYYVR